MYNLATIMQDCSYTACIQLLIFVRLCALCKLERIISRLQGLANARLSQACCKVAGASLSVAAVLNQSFIFSTYPELNSVHVLQAKQYAVWVLLAQPELTYASEMQ